MKAGTTEGRTTAFFCGVAVVLTLLAWATAPRVSAPSIFTDRGGLFFPAFTDPNAASSLEVVAFDEQTAAIRPLKVVNRGGRWIIPSHYDYPADAKDRLSQLAAAVIALRKDDFVSDNPADHERCGVLDPLDAALPQLKGRGTRVTIRGDGDQVLADVIVGNAADGREGFLYVRLPGQKRIWMSRVGELQPSTDFADWIERDLLQAAREEIDEIGVHNYSLDEATGRLHMREAFSIRRTGPDKWTVVGQGSSEEVDARPMNLLLSSLVSLRITGVLPKPPGITAMLSRSAAGGGVSRTDVEDLARKGFVITPQGELFANEGEIVVHTSGGLFYTLRFGEVASGMAGAAPGAATPAATEPQKVPGESRYLFVMVGYDAGTIRPSAGGTAPPAQAAADVEQRTALLRARFAPWYYIISADSFANLRVARKDLVQRTPGSPDT